MSMICAICSQGKRREGSTKEENLYKLGATLTELGIQGDFAHPRCVLAQRDKMYKEAADNSMTFTQYISHLKKTKRLT